MSDSEDHYDPNRPPRREGPNRPVAAGEYFQSSVAQLWRHFDDPVYQEKMRSAESERVGRENEILRRQRLPKLMRRGVPKVVAEVICDGLVRDEPCVRILRSTMASALVLSGGTGIGKTLAASLWVDEGGDTSRLVSALQLALLTKARVDREMFETLCTCSVLAVDDLGIEVDDDRGAFRSRLDGLLSRRIGNRLRTVVTTNLTGKLFESPVTGYGGRVWSRLVQHGHFEEVKAPDLRLRAACHS
ncbi:hypothetical protein LCGC14_2308390 [marine sediment metagenome]|uniref:Uncharacterized protein n=1 Tax=marine sediment metagenome TaxID=412755 RepID=A0A0F9CLV2_9ZZZZ